jgi:flagellar export protein FliJ
LARLTSLRERQVEQLSADMVDRRAVQRRYMGNIERLEQLCESAGPSGAAPRGAVPALSMNCAAFKQAVMQLTAAHRVDLSLHEADMAVAGRTLAGAVQRHEALDQVLARARAGAQQMQKRRDQKLQDETAVQTWTRSRK